ncbi:hypothetical protein GLOTRDRAFT_111867 [Gloeophyllum trabeum ATCC 11539]|uniref:Uncharacterized protein n=1 Tax=Gloeophyllum trabeum (strain ATCC 11539 / FP-39264 / Madison 617) TaxID=670483 RepID=S7RKE9_GLOTA|nr:uncharacterized protein GLOTRDRAFT_111867 [Gloeophyllum trabeum ATCC 11539]EPQ53139.1 hypothetical protein GLOTRDRAFT_111867 [Gloeophyllum trabeum ATCC 11539]
MKVRMAPLLSLWRTLGTAYLPSLLLAKLSFPKIIFPGSAKTVAGTISFLTGPPCGFVGARELR